ncbi:uncharacterized protein LOC127705949 [Mytilus californianus]|uniref:uncharacterized protein LOC127705949 n=1 Tax=Mytilus californianus TaxID=6549 RepID=UPI0022472471|nr:uncharacterized protein LOC127705949 [Mytilus californianus]
MHKSFRDIYVSAEVRRIHMMKKKPAKGLQALASGTLALARCHTVLDKTEQQLEHAIERENRAPKTMIERAQMKGEKLIHTKPVLLCVVMLNIIDCILVLGELVLDMYYIKALMESHEDVTHTFITEMKILYPNVLYNIGKSDIEPLYDNILHAQIDWDNFTMAHSKSLQDKLSAKNITKLSLQHSIVKREAELPSHIDKFINDRINHTHFHNNRHVEDHPIEEVLAHAFHKASISILCILAAENLFKIFSYGKAFFERKLEMFDCMVVFCSLFVDVYFLKGISAFKIQDFVIILAFLMPWRVIRVVNSLVVSVIEHEHFRMKLLYKQKKNIANDLKKVKSEAKVLRQCLDVVQKMAIDGGIPEPKISQHLALLQQKQNKKNKIFEENIKQSLPLSPFKKSSESSSSEPLSVENGSSCRTVHNYTDEDNNTISNVGGTDNNMV